MSISSCSQQTFLSSLEERQKECRLYVDKIGDILKNNMANLSVYMVCVLVISLVIRAQSRPCAGLLREPSHGHQGVAVPASVKSGAFGLSPGSSSNTHDCRAVLICHPSACGTIQLLEISTYQVIYWFLVRSDTLQLLIVCLMLAPSATNHQIPTSIQAGESTVVPWLGATTAHLYRSSTIPIPEKIATI